MSTRLPTDFQPSVLVERIILGAVRSDPVRLHGAIVAALEIHGPANARQDVFAPAIAAALAADPRIGASVASAIRSHHLTTPGWRSRACSGGPRLLRRQPVASG